MNIDVAKFLTAIYKDTGELPLICDKEFISGILYSKLYDDFREALHDLNCPEDSETYATAMKALDYTYERLIAVYGNTLAYIKDEVVDFLESTEKKDEDPQE